MSIAMWSAMSLIFAGNAFAVQTDEGTEVVAETVAEQNIVAAPVSSENNDGVTEDLALTDVEQPDQDADAFFDGPLAYDGESDDAVVARLRDYLENIDTLQGDFTQIAPSGAISAGKFYLRRPGLLRFEYEPPTPLLIVANGGLVYVRDEALETTDSYPVGKTPLKFLLRKKIEMEDAKIVGVDRGVDTVSVTFASQDDETEGELSVVVSAPEMELKRWIVRDLQNGITVVTLENVVEGERLASRLFEAPDAGGMFLKD